MKIAKYCSDCGALLDAGVCRRCGNPSAGRRDPVRLLVGWAAALVILVIVVFAASSLISAVQDHNDNEKACDAAHGEVDAQEDFDDMAAALRRAADICGD